MRDKELQKKFHNKKFLKTNEFAVFAGKLVAAAKDYKVLAVLILVAALVLVVGVYGLRWHRLKRAQAFNERLYQAQTGLKKETLYREILNEYSDIPASQYARLALVDYLLDHNRADEVAQEILMGLKRPGPDIFTTLLVVKNIAILKGRGEFLDAASFADKNRDRVLQTFRGRLDLITANLYLLAGKKESARDTLEKIVASAQRKEAGQVGVTGFDPRVVKEARDRLLLLDLGVL